MFLGVVLAVYLGHGIDRFFGGVVIAVYLRPWHVFSGSSLDFSPNQFLGEVLASSQSEG